MRYLVTGGCGFLGSNLAAEVIGRGDELVVFDNLSRVGAAANLDWLRGLGRFTMLHGDVRREPDVDAAVAAARPDVVFHLAGQVAMMTSITDPRRDFEINARGSFAVLDAVHRLAPDAIVLYSSTNKVYGDLDWLRYEETATRYAAPEYPEGFDESLPFAPTSPYGISKATADLYMREFTRTYGVRTVVFRHSSMYGGRQFATFDQGWVGWFCQRALAKRDGNDEPITVAGTGKQVRDLLHVNDLVRLYVSAVERVDDVAGEVFNIGGGMANSLSIVELLEMLSDTVGTTLPFVSNEPRPGDQKVFVADNAKAMRHLGWHPSVSASVGVSRMVAWLSSAKAQGLIAG